MLRSRLVQILFGIAILCLGTGAALGADFTLDWDQLSWPQAASPNNFSESFNVGPGAVTVTFTGDLDAFFNGSPSIRDTPTGGLSPAQDVLRANANFASGSSNSIPIVIDFSHAGGVTDVSFSLFSVDRFPGSGGSWDQVTVTATNGAATFNPSSITLGNADPNVGNQILSANTVSGTSAVPATSSDANATFTFNQPGIQQVTIDYRYPGTDANPPSQSIGLHDIDFSISPANTVDLALAKVVNDPTPNAGDTITFTLSVTNEGGQPASNVEVSDVIPGGYSFSGSSGTGSYDSGSGTWAVGGVPADSTVAIDLFAVVNASGPYLNTAEIVAMDETDIDSTPDNDNPTEDDQDSATISINLPPDAVDDTVEANTNTPLNIDVLDNDSDPQGDPLRITLPSPATTAGGTVAVDSNGTPTDFSDDFVRYQPPTGFSGSDSFVYQIDDGSGGSDTATVSIEVIARVDLSLTKTVDDASPNVGETITFTLVVSNSSSLVATNVEVSDDLPDGYEFTGSSGAGSYDDDEGIWTIPSIVAGGSATLGVQVTVNPSGPYLNIAEIVALDQNDTDSTPDNGDPTEDDQDSATILLNLPPEAGDDSVEADTNTPLDIDVLDNDSDPQGDPLRITLPSPTTTAGGSVAVNNNGTPGDFNDDFVRYQPPVGFSGSDGFTYQVDDGSGGTDTATVTINVIARVDLSLTKTVDDASPNAGETVVFTLLVTNDSGLPATNVEVSDELPDGYDFSGSSGSGSYDDDTGIWTISAVAAGGSATLSLFAVVNSSGPYLNVAEIVALDQIDTDSTPDNDDPAEDDQDSATILLNLPPIAVDDTAETNLNTALAIDVLANDSDPQEDPLQITLPSPTTSQGGSVAVNINGTPSDPSDDFINYQPPAGFGGTDSFEYVVNDGSGGTDSATVTVEVIAIVADLSLAKTIDTVPTAGSQVTFTLVVSNAGPDAAVVQVTDRLADGFTFVEATGDGSYSSSSGVWTAGTVAAGSSATLNILAGVNPSGSYGNTAEVTASNAFDPDSTPGNNNPTEDDRATIGSSFNNPPDALDDSFSVAIDTPTALDVLANDQDPDGDAVTLSLPTTISAAGAGLSIDDRGTPSIPGDDRIGYIPRPGFNGVDSFEYRIEDPSGGSDTATVTVTVSSEFNLFLQIRPDRREVTVGEVLRYTITASNVGTNNLSGLRWTDRIPSGFQFVPESVRVEPTIPGLRIEGSGPVVFDGLTIPAGRTLTVSYMLRVGAGTTHGEYTNVVDATDAGGPIGNTASVTVEVVGDPDFEESTLLGKVFHDRNGNARQDEGEEGLGGVRLATPEGLVVETDGHGRYHLAGLDVGRGERGRNQALKVDPASLPAGTEFTTENPRVQRLTQGLPSRIDFGVRIPDAAPADGSRSVLPLPEGGSLLVTEDPAGLAPWLSISEPERLTVDRNGHLAPITFHYHVNYTAFLNRIELVILPGSADRRQAPLAEIGAAVDAFGTVTWTPPQSLRARVGDPFQYFLRVDDGLGRTDATRIRSISVGEIQESVPPSPTIDNATTELLLSRNDLSTRNIPLRGSRVRIRGERLPGWAGLTIDGDSWPVDGTGNFAAEYLVPLGRRVFGVELRSRNGAVVEYDLPLTVTGRHLFLVGLADATVSGNSLSGRLEPVAADDRFGDEFSTDGRLAVYLKGKIKGKYLMTAQLDTGEESLDELGNLATKDPSDVFRRLDPDRYYAVYGDDSTTIRDVDSQGKFYVRLDWDRSHALWGNYHTGLTGTELVRYNRSLYGAKLHRRTFRTTSTGDPRGELILFGSENQTAPGHSEFLGTGGSLYFLKHTGILPGSEKAWVEIRQRDTGRVIERRTLVRGADYDIDERQGRLILARPLQQVVEQFRPSIVQDEPLDGDRAVLLVDYEYVPEGFDAGQLSAGVRSRQWLGDHVGLGASFVNEERDGQNYEVTGTDLTFQHSPGTYAKVEYARTEASRAEQFISDNGGLSFLSAGTSPAQRRSGVAVAFEGRADFDSWIGGEGGWVGSTWWRTTEGEFSSAHRDDGEDTVDYGFELAGDIGDHFSLAARAGFIDRRESGKDEKISVQGDYAITEQATLSAEVRHSSLPRGPADDNVDTMLAALRYSHRIRNLVELYAGGQATVDDDNDAGDNGLATFGARAWLGRATLHGSVSTGDRGAGGTLGADLKINDDHRIYGSYTVSTDRSHRVRKDGLTLGHRARISDQTTVYAENRFADSHSGSGLARVFGLDFLPRRGWSLGLSMQQGELDGASGRVDRQAATVSVARREDGLGWTTTLEFRRDEGAETRDQWLASNRVDYDIGDNARLLARLNLAETEDEFDPRLDTSLVEGTIGVAVRPVKNDRWNLLGKITFLEDLPGAEQVDGTADQRSRIFSVESIVRVNDRWELTGKLAARRGELRLDRNAGPWIRSDVQFGAVRAQYHVIHGWDGLLEYRYLSTEDADGVRQGALIGLERHLGGHVKLGAGYNFTDFSDDLTDLDYDHNGWFVSLTGKY